MTKKDKINKEAFQESFQRAANEFKNGYLMAQCTDKFFLEQVDKNGDVNVPISELVAHGLDIRIFNEQGEIKWVRASIADEEFRCRKIVDEQKLSEKDYWDEEQYLDIDMEKSDFSNKMARTTGGGWYHLPLDNYNNARMIVRNYLDDDKDTGMASVSDWRLLGFKEEKEADVNVPEAQKV